MTPAFMAESGYSAAVMGVLAQQDRDGVAVLDDIDSTVLFQGNYSDAQDFMGMRGLTPHFDCELVDNDPRFMVGFEAF